MDAPEPTRTQRELARTLVGATADDIAQSIATHVAAEIVHDRKNMRCIADGYKSDRDALLKEVEVLREKTKWAQRPTRTNLQP